MYVWVLILQKDKAKDFEASRMTALLVEDNLSFSEPELIDDGGDDQLDLPITSSEELPSTTSSISPIVSLSGSGANSLPCVTPKLSWTSQTFPSPLETSRIGSSNWRVPWGSRGGREFGENGYRSEYGGYDAGYNYGAGAGAGADHYCPRSGPYSAEPYYGRLGEFGSANGVAVSIIHVHVDSCSVCTQLLVA